MEYYLLQHGAAFQSQSRQNPPWQLSRKKHHEITIGTIDVKLRKRNICNASKNNNPGKELEERHTQMNSKRERERERADLIF